MTQAELAAAIPCAQGTLSKYESAVNPLTDDFIKDASRVLAYPPRFFYQPGQMYGFPPFHYRRRKKLSAKVLGRIVAEMNIRRLHVAALSRSIERKSNRFIPEIDMDEFQGGQKRRPTVEEVARTVREAWGLRSGPVPNMAELIEENGGIVIPCDFGTDLIDAMSQRIDGMPVLFFVNANSPADRLRFTLAHELAHMVIHTTAFKDDAEMESEADEFAGAFLLPADEIKVQLRRFDLRQVANMKSHWKVSMAAIAMRAARLNLITPYQHRSFIIEMNKLGLGKREPNEPLRERPNALRSMVSYHQKSLGYSDKDLADLLCVTSTELNHLYAPEEPAPIRHLRLVK